MLTCEIEVRKIGVETTESTMAFMSLASKDDKNQECISITFNSKTIKIPVAHIMDLLTEDTLSRDQL